MRLALASAALALAACTGGSPETRPTTAAPATPAPALATDLKDGNHHAFVTAFDGHTVTVDVAQFLTGRAGVAAAREAGEEPFDYFIKNENPRLRTLTVAAGVRITAAGQLAGYAGREDVLTAEQLAAAVDGGRAEGALFVVTLSGGAVVSMREMFLG